MSALEGTLRPKVNLRSPSKDNQESRFTMLTLNFDLYSFYVDFNRSQRGSLTKVHGIFCLPSVKIRSVRILTKGFILIRET